MLTQVTALGATGYRIDCDGCGEKDEHDRGPDGEILFCHMEPDDAYASSQCTECDNGPGFIHTTDGKDLCPTCRDHPAAGKE